MDYYGTRHDRNQRLFGTEGQNSLRSAKVGVVGLGGTGSVLVQQLAFLGVGHLVLVDQDKVERTNRNRLVGITEHDEDGKTNKTEVAHRTIQDIDPSIEAACVTEPIWSYAALAHLKSVHWLFGAVDDDAARLVLNHLHCAFCIPYIDVATEVAGGEAGGRVAVMTTQRPCLWCMHELDGDEIRRGFQGSAEQEEAAVYGIPTARIGGVGPAVAPLNCVTAGLAATEFMLHTTGMRAARPYLVYRTSRGNVTHSHDRANNDCLYCVGQWGIGNLADIERYAR